MDRDAPLGVVGWWFGVALGRKKSVNLDCDAAEERLRRRSNCLVLDPADLAELQLS
jgi:hypothetical protein